MSEEHPVERREVGDLQIQIAALNYVLTHIAKVALLNAGITPAQVGEMRKEAREGLAQQTIGGTDPVLSDHIAGELTDRVDELLSQIEDQVVNAYERALKRNP